MFVVQHGKMWNDSVGMNTLITILPHSRLMGEAGDLLPYSDKNMRHKGFKHFECVGGRSVGLHLLQTQFKWIFCLGSHTSRQSISTKNPSVTLIYR